MRNWTGAAVTIILAAFCIMVLSAISAERWNHLDEVAQAEITAEEQERREQAAYYKGWQDGKQYYLENFGGRANDRKGLLRSNPGHRPAGCCR